MDWMTWIVLLTAIGLVVFVATCRIKISLRAQIKNVFSKGSRPQEFDSFTNSILENLPNMIFVKDAKELRFVRINKAGEQLLGFTQEDLVGKNDFDFFPKEQAKFFIQKDRQVLEEQKLVDIPVEPILTKNNEERLLHTKKIPILDDAGEPLFLLGISEDITEKIKAEKNLIQSLKEKEVLLKEVHHRVKNNLQVISSIISLQASYEKDKKMLEVFKEIQDRIKSMSFIHESLYQTKDFSRINFSEYLSVLSENLVHSYQIFDGSIQLKYEVDAVHLDLDHAIPCGLIVNELVSNAIKHGFPGGRKGSIVLGLKEDGDHIIVAVSDNGVGLDPDIDFKKTDSLGLQLVVTLCEQLNGSINFDPTDGAAFSIRFPRNMRSE